MAIRFIDVEKAYAIIPRKMTMGTLMWIGVPEGGQIGGGDTKSRELCGPGVSGESKVNVGQIQGSALSPLLFIAVVELISRKICIKVVLQKLLYAGGLAVVDNGEANLQ